MMILGFRCRADRSYMLNRPFSFCGVDLLDVRFMRNRDLFTLLRGCQEWVDY